MKIPDAVAVVSYPGHCLTTVATIKNLLDLTSWQVPFYIFVDDLGPQWEAWPDYLKDFDQLLRSSVDIDPVYIQFSKFNFGHIWDGWLRQQMVKLNVDRYLPGTTWYVTDGDVELKRVIEFGETPYNYLTNNNALVNEQNESYIGHILKVPDPRVRRGSEPVFTHLAPFRWLEREHLEGLRRYAGKRLVNDFNLAHINLMREERIIGYGPTPDCLSMTEWDLYEVYRQQIAGVDLNLRYWLNQTCTERENDHPPTWYWTFFGTDRDIDPTWFEERGIQVNDTLWKQMAIIRRT